MLRCCGGSGGIRACSGVVGWGVLLCCTVYNSGQPTVPLPGIALLKGGRPSFVPGVSWWSHDLRSLTSAHVLFQLKSDPRRCRKGSGTLQTTLPDSHKSTAGVLPHPQGADFNGVNGWPEAFWVVLEGFEVGGRIGRPPDGVSGH